MATTKKWGFDVRELEPTIRPQDDFYRYVNERWMDANPIPKEESRWGTFIKLRFDADKRLRAILDELESAKRLPSDSPERLVRDFYRSGMNMELRNKLDLAPLSELRDDIARAKDHVALQKVIAKLHRLGVGVLFGMGVDQDAKQSDRYALHLFQDGLGMPDREYYLKDDPESVRVRDAYVRHVEGLFVLLGRTKEAAAKEALAFIAFETALAKVSMKKEDARDAEKTYHPHTIIRLKKLAPSFGWDQYLTRTNAGHVTDLIVMQPQFVESATKLFAALPLSEAKAYLEWHLVSDFSGLLSDRFIKHSFSFYSTTLMGTKVMKPLWRRVTNVVNGHVGELLGQIYVKKHFPPEAKEKMNAIVDDLFTAYEARINSLDWMGPSTKKKALVKLRALTRKIGYPDKWKSYKGLEINAKDFVGNVMRSNEYEHKRAMKKLKGPIDRGEWFMYPQTVNAYFAPNLNDIVFPAAILQPPFFGLSNDAGLNYGCIGAVIGHEITHGFDDQGAKFDHEGNLKTWWTPEDKKRFEAKGARVEEQFNEYTVADGVHVNGKLTLGENIADLGGLSIAYDAYQLELERNGRRDIDGLTPEQRFFIGFALFERENMRPEVEKFQVLNDPHSPGKFRINGPLSNFEPFYDAFGVRTGDQMFRAPKDREMVW